MRAYTTNNKRCMYFMENTYIKEHTPNPNPDSTNATGENRRTF